MIDYIQTARLAGLHHSSFGRHKVRQGKRGFALSWSHL